METMSEKTINVLFDYERDGKNTVRFTERNENREPVIGKLYMRKAAYDRLGKPKAINLAVTAA
jgi:hypothetical protein